MKLLDGNRWAMVLVLLGGSLCNRAQAQAITVIVNNQPVSFVGAPPIQQNGAVLVPLRGVFEALGASVNYNPNSKTISAQKGDSTVSLSLGSTSAYVNGHLQTLTHAAETVGGSTLVPLRFVAESLGANVQWIPTTTTVQIVTSDAHLSALPPPPVQQAASGHDEVIGQLTGVYTNTDPQRITVRLNGRNTVVPVSQNTVILIRQNDEPGTQSDLHSLDVGDQVRVRLDSGGAAATIEAVYGEILGTVKNIEKLNDGTYVVSLNDGTNIQMSRDASVMMAGRRLEFRDVMSSDKVRIRTDQNNKIGFSLEVINDDRNFGDQSAVPGQKNSLNLAIDSLQTDAVGPIGQDAVLHVSMTGTPGCTAVFSVGALVNNAAMTEVQSGQYEGRYIVPSDADVSANVIGTLTEPNTAISTQAKSATAIKILSIPPVIASENPPADTVASTMRPVIYALLDDSSGSGIDASSIKIKVDGADVTKEATITNHFVTYQSTSQMAAGTHTVEIAASDKLGNHRLRSWSFVTGAPRLVVSFKSDRSEHTVILKSGESLDLTLNAQPGGTAFATMSSVKIPLAETRPGVYTGTIKCTTSSSVQSSPVIAHFSALDHANVTATLAQNVTIDAGIPPAPQINFPAAGQQIGKNVEIAGVGVPGGTIDVTIGYSTRALGMFDVSGTAAQTQVVADDSGNWQTDKIAVITPALMSSAHNTGLTIKATAVDALGQRSACSSVKVLYQ